MYAFAMVLIWFFGACYFVGDMWADAKRLDYWREENLQRLYDFLHSHSFTDKLKGLWVLLLYVGAYYLAWGIRLTLLLPAAGVIFALVCALFR